MIVKPQRGSPVALRNAEAPERRVTTRPGRAPLLSAFTAVYLIWGSTYLGIRYAVESIPPLLMAGSRFAVAGAVLLLVGKLRGDERPDRAEWRGAAVTGLLLIGVGNGGVTWAEQTVPSGIAALVASVVPLWMALMDWARPGGARPSFPTFAGLALGLAGLAVLLGGDVTGAPLQVGGSAAGMTVLVLATIGWALGSVIASDVRLPRSPITAIGAQMTLGGGALLAAGLVAGEGAAFDATLVTTRSVISWTYLVVFGSWIGFTAYVWLLRNTTPAKASTYAFVNPVVALILGVWLASEPLDPRTVAAIATILAGVALIVLHRGRAVSDPEVEGPGRHPARIPGPLALRRERRTKGEVA